MFQKIILKAVRFYQNFISPNLLHRCRFYPSCSQYTYLAIGKYGFFLGTWQGLKRILRCHRWNPGGVDIP